MSLPSFVPLPPGKLKNQIASSEWNAFLSAWNSLTRAYLNLSPQDFPKQAFQADARVEEFLESFIKYASIQKGRFSENELERSLKQSCLLLISRLSSSSSGQKFRKIGQIAFIEHLCLLYVGSSDLAGVANVLWQAATVNSKRDLLDWKNNCTKTMNTLNSFPNSQVEDQIAKIVTCVKTIPRCGSFLMEGSDFLDALISSWEQNGFDVSRKLSLLAFYCLIGLLNVESPNESLLLDHLYSLKVNHEERKRHSKSSSLLEQILGTTSFLVVLKQQFSSTKGRGYTLLHDLTDVARISGLRPRRIHTRNTDKGKGKASHSDDQELHIHRMSLVTQVQDLFPSLDVPQILQLLDRYSDDTEKAIAYLLDNPPSPSTSTKPHNLETSPLPTVAETISKLPPHMPYVSQAPSRKNIYDDEDLATLSLDSTQLFKGHRPETNVFQTPSTSTKAAILSALAAFDSDSDERDDTYDVDDVGGTVDTSVAGAGEDDSNENEETLYLAWKSTPNLFTRDTTTRRSKARIDLRGKTGLTDESIEGWGIMLSRDTRRQSRLEKRYSAFAGQQAELQSSSWKGSDEAVDSEGETKRHHSDRGRGGRVRGRGTGRGRVKAPQATGAEGSANADSSTTANERRRKDANKGSRANHNRRDQRAKKISRAGFPG